MDRQKIRQKISEVAMIDECELSKGELDRLEEVFQRGYDTAMPVWAFEMLGTETLDQRIYKLGHMTRLVSLRSFLCVGRSKIVRK